MELCKGEIQAYCWDVSEGALALIRSALSIRNLSFILSDVEITTYNNEQSCCLDNIINDIMFNFTEYYYAVDDNYLDHPYYRVPLVVGEEVKDYHKNYFENNPLFEVKYERLSDTSQKVLFRIKDKRKCIQALDVYLSNFGCDQVFNDDMNLLTCETQDKQLYKLLTEDEYNLNNFVVIDLKYIKAICYNEYLDKISISNVSIDFDENNNLKFRCIISACGFVEEYGKDSTTENEKQEAKADKPKKPKKNFSPSVKELYDYIKTYAPAKGFQIYKEDLIGDDRRNRLYAGMGMLTTMVNRLNKEYREISNRDITLMKFDKFLNCYIITNIWEE